MNVNGSTPTRPPADTTSSPSPFRIRGRRALASEQPIIPSLSNSNSPVVLGRASNPAWMNPPGTIERLSRQFEFEQLNAPSPDRGLSASNLSLALAPRPRVQQDHASADDHASPLYQSPARAQAVASELNAETGLQTTPQSTPIRIKNKRARVLGHGETPATDKTAILNGSPVKIARDPSTPLVEYLKRVEQQEVPSSSRLDEAQVIFVGTNHDSFAFLSLVEQLVDLGVNIDAVFMEEINADDRNVMPGGQAILDRHFVANDERAELGYAHPVDSLKKEGLIRHFTKEAAPYLGKQEGELAPRFEAFLEKIKGKNIKLGGIDYSKNRYDMGLIGYGSDRFSKMNRFAADVVRCYIDNRQAKPAEENEQKSQEKENKKAGLILVSAGNAHLQDGFEAHKRVEHDDINIRGIQDLFKISMPKLKVSDLSLVLDYSDKHLNQAAPERIVVDAHEEAGPLSYVVKVQPKQRQGGEGVKRNDFEFTTRYGVLVPSRDIDNAMKNLAKQISGVESDEKKD